MTKYKTLDELFESQKRYKFWRDIQYYCFYIWWNKITDLKWQIPNILQRARYGVGHADVWNFDIYLCDIMMRGLKQFKKDMNGIPSDIYWKYVKHSKLSIIEKDALAMREWSEIIDKISDGFKSAKLLVEESYNLSEVERMTLERTREEGFDLFKRYFFALND